VHFVGDGSMLEEMKQFVKDNNMDSVVSFYGRRPVEEMPDFYKLADACLVSLDAKNETGLTLPAKVQGYMAAGKTILGMISGSTQEVVRDAQCGACVDSSDVDAFADMLKDFVEVGCRITIARVAPFNKSK
jgi:glycosyltransferase involved in cell wall biosynthesis